MAPGYLSVNNKYFLSGFDWVMGVLDLIMKRTTCAGNASQIVLMLDAPIDERSFRTSMEGFLAGFPVVAGRVSRHWTLAPYWQMPGPKGKPSLSLTSTRIDSAVERDLLAELTKFINTPFRSGRDHLVFHLVSSPGRQCLAMTFDHLLFDARGAEAFISLFQQYLAGRQGIGKNITLTRSIDLTQWKRKFLAGQAVNRKMIALSQEPIRALPIIGSCTGKGFKYRVLNFDREASARITDRAFDEAGYLMIMPYLFSGVIKAVHALFEARGAAPGAYVIPVSLDMRQAKDIRQELFFNHNSMFFFQIRPADVDDRKRLINAIKEQMYEQVQSRLPQKLWDASSLTRIAPLTLLNRIFRLPLDGKIASFCFSHVSKCTYDSHELMGSRITNVFHMPRTPVPPGIGVFFNSFDSRLNATISWLDGLFADVEMEDLERTLRDGL
ncbi:MAG: hypothetical protein A2X56_08405 [Nitrospirae bacterium GWC2_57_13]|jgi:hypothetical protein|nr:MAG: hypothetical protein A2X56_08405 [Nitrospirae bacterium GWC2_57_13]OGW45696.1 MAG: hypothetical protein A2X57_07265 [Nitrospirae bacterium GWD2_57_8]